ncbi:hypothetical protein O6R05_03585 [Peptoniphilus equinus]|uniref:Uncharacterized protein n=1 Tax=Peptoniphilus equinus TaxID=3016343 RepID=A0ABY7QW93_9FIRM|nr:hypothetical protein [Peptoniphilus equinus]WBW50641.1 hypothetical protein O6R05_03585 [Peptoniphilus equinus]
MEQSYINNGQFNDNFCIKDVKRFLIEKFLYDNDTESLNILLNIYQVEGSVENICPTYLSLKHLKKDIMKFLKDKEGVELIANNLGRLIHDDVNRLELYLYLEGYKAGIRSKKSVNLLEILTFKYFDVEDLYRRRKLFNRGAMRPEAENLKTVILQDMNQDKRIKNHIYDVVFRFNLKVLKRKVYNLNLHLDNQMMFNLEEGGTIRESKSKLTRRELRGLDKKILRFLFMDGVRIFETAFWDGINDQVMKRYR